MTLGAFSLSLSVKDLGISRAFYEKLGFAPIGGDGERYQIMKNGSTIVGLYEGMFEGNMLTFNPGWSGPHEEMDSFTDVRELEKRLAGLGVEPLSSNTTENDAGPANFVIQDPDGNTILLDQHR